MLDTVRLRVDCPIALAAADPDVAARFLSGRTPKGVASLAAKRIARAEKRQKARELTESQLLEEVKKDGRIARSWRAAVLARVVAAQSKG